MIVMILASREGVPAGLRPCCDYSLPSMAVFIKPHNSQIYGRIFVDFYIVVSACPWYDKNEQWRMCIFWKNKQRSALLKNARTGNTWSVSLKSKSV